MSEEREQKIFQRTLLCSECGELFSEHESLECYCLGCKKPICESCGTPDSRDCWHDACYREHLMSE